MSKCQAWSEPRTIVRDLAKRGPFAIDNPYGGSSCADCLVGSTLGEGLDDEAFRDHANHEPGCLWRRAKEAM